AVVADLIGRAGRVVVDGAVAVVVDAVASFGAGRLDGRARDRGARALRDPGPAEPGLAGVARIARARAAGEPGELEDVVVEVAVVAEARAADGAILEADVERV